MIGGINMKKILSIILILSLTACSSSKYVMQELDEPVRNIYTENFYAYIYKPKGHTDEEFKEFFNIDPGVDISLDDFRLLYLTADFEKIPDFGLTMLFLIDTKTNDFYLNGAEIPYNPWKKEFEDILPDPFYFYDGDSNSNFDFCSSCKVDYFRNCSYAAAYYIGDATDEEILNYIRRIYFGFSLPDENDYYIAYLLHHLYQINDVNIIFEQSDGEIVRIQ